MLTKEKVKEIAEKYIKEKNISYQTLTEDPERIGFRNNKEMLHGRNTGKYIDVFFYSFTQLWGLEKRGFVMYIEAEKGEIQYIMTPHGYMDIEE